MHVATATPVAKRPHGARVALARGAFGVIVAQPKPKCEVEPCAQMWLACAEPSIGVGGIYM